MTMDTLINRTGSELVGAYMRLALNLDIERQAPLPPGAKIIAANHPTTTDPFYVLSLVREPVYVLVTEMAFKSPVLGPVLRASGHIQVIAGQGRAAFDAAVRRLQDGNTVAIFPEGTLSPEGALHPPRTGAVRLALIAGVPVIPVGIHLDRQRVFTVETTCGDMTGLARWYPFGPYAMTIGEAMRFGGSAEDREYVQQMSDLLIARIGHLARESAFRVAAWSEAPLLRRILWRLPVAQLLRAG